MEPRTAIVRTLGIVGILGLCALASQDDKGIYREDEGAILVETEPDEDGWEEAGDPVARISRRVDGDWIELRRGGAVEPGEWAGFRGPSDHIGALRWATSNGDGRSVVVWDEYKARGTEERSEGVGSFDVLGVFVDGEGPGAPFVIAEGPRYQANPTVAADGDTVYVAWEEGPDDLGASYTSVDQKWNNATDASGPLHSWREVHLARVTPDGSVTEIHVPMPSFEVQRLEPGRRPGAARVGVFYERPELGAAPGASESSGVWLAYRQMHQREAALQIPKLDTHVEHGFAVFARHFDGTAFGPLQKLDQRQRDGEQRLSFAFEPGPGAAPRLRYETGRADRRRDRQHKGAVGAVLAAGEPSQYAAASMGAVRNRRLAEPARPTPKSHPVEEVIDGAGVGSGAKPFTLLFGDLHRHTDLSLCFPFFDGSLKDAYRYAQGPGALDFIAVTDHARDLNRGRGSGRPWRLHVDAADRYHQPGRFVAFRAYERSQSDTDHNVIGLAADADFLRPHRPPLEAFWAGFPPSSVLTIPHATSWRPGARFNGNVWQKRDDLRRPIAEVYQGFRDVESSLELQTNGLMSGQKLGFIASSDHMSTSSAYACAWVEGAPAKALDREPVFAALGARRCYGATARIELVALATPLSAPLATGGEDEAGEPRYWMGADLPVGESFGIQVSVRGTAKIQAVELWSDGEVLHRAAGEESSTLIVRWPWNPPVDRPSYLFARVLQEDGHKAWSSPFFSRWPTVTSTPPSEGR